MPMDVLIYAVIAVFLGLWLRNMLGTKHGGERQRPNPFEKSESQDNVLDQKEVKEHIAAYERKQDSQAEATQTPALSPEMLKQIDDKNIEDGLFQISLADKEFNLETFVENAKDAFVFIVGAFADGDRETLQDLLSQNVYEPFEEAISDRESRGEVVDLDVHAVKEANILKAEMDGKTALITVRFVASETTVLKNKEGDILSGNPNTTVEKIDVWTFGRNTKSNDPRWFLYETLSESSA
jgi:predicted lipid-binding transport protein (Tim44 family)